MTGDAENAALANGFLANGMDIVTKPFALEAGGTHSPHHRFATRAAAVPSSPLNAPTLGFHRSRRWDSRGVV